MEKAPLVQIHTADLAPVVTPELKSVASMKQLVPSLVVASHEDYEFASDLLRQVKGEAKRLDERRKEITGPLNVALKSINDLFRPVISGWETVEATIKSKLSAYSAQIEAAQLAAMQAEASATPPPKDLVLAKPTAEGISVRRVLRWKISDESKVGRDWCSPDPAKIEATLNAGGRVPGVEIWYEDVISARAK